jgi:D-alanyl-D-alanine carboxypeptidase
LAQQPYSFAMPRARQGLVKIATLAALQLSGVAGARAGELSPQNLERIDTLVAHFLQPHASPAPAPPPSISIIVGGDGRQLLAKAYGEAHDGVPATERTLYHIGSLTKQFTAAAVLHLIEERVAAPLSGAPLTLDTPMWAIFEDVDNWTTQGEAPITVRSLLTMTSNLPNFTRRPPQNVDPWGAVPAPRLLDELKKWSPRGWPNSFEYSNTSYFLLAQIIGRVAPHHSAGNYRDYVRAATIDKARMTHTGFVGDYAPGSDLAEPHYRRKPAFAQPDWLDGCGDMVSNAVDLFAWNSALMGGSVMGPESLSEMFSDGARVDPTTYYGMGWFVEHNDSWDKFSHSGSVPGYTSYNAIHKRRADGSWLSVTLLTNSDGVEGLNDLADEIFDVAAIER